ncbi:hypothetical protein J7E62_24530 [Variovorax paradoxus]|nr:hypothetical protein [Variovorax paradoxus]
MSNFQRLDAVPPFVKITAEGVDDATRELLKWSAEFDPPSIGSDITLRINQIGRAKVTGYASIDGWLGVMCVPYNPPDWWVKQNGPPSVKNDSLAFGAEISL